MSLGLSAPAAVKVQISSGVGVSGGIRSGDRADHRRVFRLSREIGTGGVLLERPAPFEPGSPVLVRFSLPGDPLVLEVDAEVVTTGDPAEEGDGGGCALHFRASMPDPEIRSAISAYISDRLGLPPLPPMGV